MSGSTTSIWPDSTQLTRIASHFPGRQFRYLPGPEVNGTVETYYGVIEGNPLDSADVGHLEALRREIGDLNVKLVLGGPDWVPR